MRGHILFIIGDAYSSFKIHLWLDGLVCSKEQLHSDGPGTLCLKNRIPGSKRHLQRAAMNIWPGNISHHGLGGLQCSSCPCPYAQCCKGQEERVPVQPTTTHPHSHQQRHLQPAGHSSWTCFCSRQPGRWLQTMERQARKHFQQRKKNKFSAHEIKCIQWVIWCLHAKIPEGN